MVVSETLGSWYNNVPPKILFHYTSPAGLLGIIRGSQLWITHFEYLNDRKEVEHINDFVEAAIKDRSSSISGDSKIIGLFERIKEELKNSALRVPLAGETERPVFIFSLTTNSDSLSQWRAYCPPNGGYAIGFPTDPLMSVAHTQKFVLCQCIYDDSIKTAIVGEGLESAISLFGTKDITGLSDTQVVKRVTFEFLRWTSQVGGLFKHKAFEAEDEWRLMSVEIYATRERNKSRAVEGGIVPYFEFTTHQDEKEKKWERFTECSLGDSRLTIVVGPNDDLPRAQRGLKTFIKLYAPGAIARQSSAPYRAR